MSPDEIADAIATIMRKHDERERYQRGPSHVALLYSGGMESSLLLSLLAPWRSKVTVYTIRTGVEFPHMIKFIDHKLSGWDHRVVTVDLAASFRDLGLPASVVPIEHLQGLGDQMNIAERAPRIAPWVYCCLRNRSAPGYDAVVADGLRDIIHGQRRGDWSKSEPRQHHWECVKSGTPLHFHHPLWDVSRTQVQDAVTAFGVELPEHYAEYSSSLDCAICPSALTTPRRAWMSKHHPEALRVAEGLHNQVRTAALASLDGDNTQNAFTVR